MKSRPHVWGDVTETVRGGEVFAKIGAYRAQPCERAGCYVARLVTATTGRTPLGFMVIGDGDVLKRPGSCEGVDARIGARKARRAAPSVPHGAKAGAA